MHAMSYIYVYIYIYTFIYAKSDKHTPCLALVETSTDIGSVQNHTLGYNGDTVITTLIPIMCNPVSSHTQPRDQHRRQRATLLTRSSLSIEIQAWILIYHTLAE